MGKVMSVIVGEHAVLNKTSPNSSTGSSWYLSKEDSSGSREEDSSGSRDRFPLIFWSSISWNEDGRRGGAVAAATPSVVAPSVVAVSS